MGCHGTCLAQQLGETNTIHFVRVCPSYTKLAWLTNHIGTMRDIELAIIHTQFKENETGRVLDFQSNVICLIKGLCRCCCFCCGCYCCCCYLSYQGSILLLLLLLLSIFLRVYIVVGYWCCSWYIFMFLCVYFQHQSIKLELQQWFHTNTSFVYLLTLDPTVIFFNDPYVRWWVNWEV